MPSEDDQTDETEIRFQQAFGARVFRQGKPRAILEVKSPDIPTAFYEARLRGYDEAKAAKENAPRKPSGSGVGRRLRPLTANDDAPARPRQHLETRVGRQRLRKRVRRLPPFSQHAIDARHADAVSLGAGSRSAARVLALALALAMPSRWRSSITSRSNCATLPMTLSIRRPVGVAVSTPMLRMRRPTRFASSRSTMRTRSATLRLEARVLLHSRHAAITDQHPFSSH
jgi:hypothetical protein